MIIRDDINFIRKYEIVKIKKKKKLSMIIMFILGEKNG